VTNANITPIKVIMILYVSKTIDQNSSCRHHRLMTITDLKENAVIFCLYRNKTHNHWFLSNWQHNTLSFSAQRRTPPHSPADTPPSS